MSLTVAQSQTRGCSAHRKQQNNLFLCLPNMDGLFLAVVVRLSSEKSLGEEVLSFLGYVRWVSFIIDETSCQSILGA